MYDVTKALSPVIQEDAESFRTVVTQVRVNSSSSSIPIMCERSTFSEEPQSYSGSHVSAFQMAAEAGTQPCSSDETRRRMRRQSAAAIMKNRRAVEQAEGKRPPVPKRSTSMSRPAKRRRHEDFVAFHRSSCQLFTSIDGTLAQIRQDIASSSSSSSSTSSSPSSPTSGTSTRDTSIDYNSSSPTLDPASTENNGIGNSNIKSQAKRPTLVRMSHNLSSSSVHISIRSRSNSTLKLESDSNIPSTNPSPPIPEHHTSMITTTSPYYSSQTTLPLSNHKPTDTTTIQWTSPETRKREYAKIDAANSGFRLLLRRIIPHGLGKKVGGGRVGFWNETAGENDGDSRSVRRFRVEDTDMDDRVDCEHSDESWDEKSVVMAGDSVGSRTTTGLSFASTCTANTAMTTATSTSTFSFWPRRSTTKIVEKVTEVAEVTEITDRNVVMRDSTDKSLLLKRLFNCHL